LVWFFSFETKNEMMQNIEAAKENGDHTAPSRLPGPDPSEPMAAPNT
jgi:hypothetical protein